MTDQLLYNLGGDGSWVELTQHDGYLTYPVGGGKQDRTPCMSFALCSRDAVTTQPHPIMGNVPMCARCDAKMAALASPPKPTDTVIVFGPNGLSDATFHVHNAACPDRNAGRYLMRCDKPWRITDARSQRHIVEVTHSDFIASDETYGDYGDRHSTWEDYRGEVRIFPCVELPETVPADAELDAASL